MPDQEKERIVAVKRFEKFDFALNNGLRGILNIAVEIFESPAAFITLIGEEEQLFLVNHGIEILKMPRETSFCTHTILRHEPMVVADALEDDRFSNCPFVINAPNIRFYAGAALADYEGHNIGTLCIMDVKPKQVAEDKKKMLVILARQAIHLMELDINYQCKTRNLLLMEQQNAALRDIAFSMSRDLDGPVGIIRKTVAAISKTDAISSPSFEILEDAVCKMEDQLQIIKTATEEARKMCVPL